MTMYLWVGIFLLGLLVVSAADALTYRSITASRLAHDRSSRAKWPN